MKILVLSRGAVGSMMGSVGVRNYHIARVLAEQLPDAQVTLSAPNQPDVAPPHPRVSLASHASPLAGFLQMLRHDVIISRDLPFYAGPLFLSKRFVLDLYVAFVIEWMAVSKRIENRARRKLWMQHKRHYIGTQLTLADYIYCSDDRQRDFWLGALASLGLVVPGSYDRDPTLRGLIDVVPYGVQPGRPQHTRQVLKGVVPGIDEADTVLIWNGALMEYFDAPTVIRAMAEVSRVRSDVKLFFLGVEHPDYVTGMLFDPPRDAVALSRALGLYERTVFFNYNWVPYAEIGNYLAEADIGVCAGFDNMEAHYAYRTRFVDLFWAELPIVCTRGDVLADRVGREGLGVVVAPGDASGFAAAVLRLVEDREFYERCRRNLALVKEELSWERVARPLVEFCRHAESMAAPKRRRLLPLLSRSAASSLVLAQRAAEYAVARARGLERRSEA